MGKIMSVGYAARKFDPDQCDISLDISISSKASGEASQEASNQCERILDKLNKLGIDSSEIEIKRDSIEKRSNNSGDYYEAQKKLLIRLPADMHIINSVRDVIEIDFKNVSFSVSFQLSKSEELRRILLNEAIDDSKLKATILAEKMGHKIVGIDSANVSGTDDVYDLTDENRRKRVLVGDIWGLGDIHPYMNMLTPEKIELETSVIIVWLLDL